ncbi:MAM and LDL-receptor class A domain-containing protein 2-like [Haliotis asinina]|uniref:MAM and LDL-receptor class A domain-containing protein 2-like n=1 Tax=Haliotis asinina TaxID=109174 RepID=UPI003531F2C8
MSLLSSGTASYYMYIEASSTHYNALARLVSPPLSLNNGQAMCLTFWYSMYGQTINYLNVYFKRSGSLGDAVWSKHGTQGPTWKKATVDITGTSPLQVVFEASRGISYTGDIAIDDISALPGTCSGSSATSTGSIPSLLSCDFEPSDSCGYHQDNSDDFDWTKKTGSTGSHGTGPLVDHTYETLAGHYYYIETSAPRSRGQKARLLSPTTNSGGTNCLTFYYSMYGSQIGQLNVYTKVNSLGAPIWTRKSNQGNSWKVAQVTIKSQSAFQLVFEGVVGSGYRGDIAIDDVNVTAGPCVAPGTCNFDKRTFCTYKNVKDGTDDFDWLLQHGHTSSSNTGPSADHSMGNSRGTYAYIETSAPRKPGENARLTSETFKPTGQNTTYCYSFWYHMYGTSVGTLMVNYVTNSTYPGSTMWQLSGNQGNAWAFGRIPVKSATEFYIMFEATVGSSYTGDIAIDQLNFHPWVCGLTPGKARPPGQTTPASTTPRSTYPPTATSLPGTINCNFESNMCGWTQATNDQFDWTRQKGTTSSSGTGPGSDHTTSKGYYIFIETSSPRHNGDKARVVSPVVNSQGTKCLQFYYHMYGPHINALNVYTQAGSNLGTAIWTKKGTQGNRWIQGSVDINVKGQYNIVFEGVRGVSYLGDIALDDITLKDGYCEGNGTTPQPGTLSNPIGKCDFENPSICGYKQDTTDRFDWTRTSHTTSSYGTGPSNDHTYGTSRGHYMYIETSAPRVQGDTARLVSPTYPPSKADLCLNFYYHMYGSHIGTLNVKLLINTHLSTVWTKSGNQGNQWSLGSATLSANDLTGNYQIAFEGVRGVSYLGDIAIDDVSITSGACASPASCTFEKGYCSWTNLQGQDDFDWTLNSGSTSSLYTGPSSDHTLATSAGKYAFIESSAPRRSGDKAWLSSTTFAASTKRCISFWYHMSGSQIGTLNVYVIVGNVNTTVWSLSGSQGDKWLNGQAPIASTTSYKVYFEGVCGGGYRGDIAIDDISITQTTCGVVPASANVHGNGTIAPLTLTTAVPTQPATGPFFCNFDSGLCSWAQDKTDTFDWSRNKGPTSSVGTGPQSDHTSGQGAYLFIETSYPRKLNDKARIISPSVAPGSGTQCFTMWYYMYGDHVNALNVYVKTTPALGNPIFTLKGTKGPKWIQAKINIPTKVRFQVVIEGVVGPSYRGDIAIDDVNISDGICSKDPDQFA